MSNFQSLEVVGHSTVARQIQVGENFNKLT